MLMKADAVVAVTTVLVESDELDLVLARDAFGAAYICALASVDRDGRRYVGVRATDARIETLRSGATSVRSALLEPEAMPRFVGFLEVSGELPTIHLEAFPDEFPEMWLPGPRFGVTPVDAEAIRDDVASEALRRNAAVVVCKLDPPESRGSRSRIDADTLAEGIRAFQSVVRYATKRAIKTRSKKHRPLALDDSATLQVVALSPGSVNIHFEAKAAANVAGASWIGEAMGTVDELTSLLKTGIDDLPEALLAHRGHVLGAYTSLLKFVASNDVALAYRWSEPALGSSLGASIRPMAAKALCAVLETKQALRSEPVEFLGHFTSVNTDKSPFSWAARDSDDKRRRGQVHESSPNVLNGVTMHTAGYIFRCEERLERSAAGRESLQLFLLDIEAV